MEFLRYQFGTLKSRDDKSCLNLSGLEKITGIHQKQLWKYLHGQANPRWAQIEKIETGLQRFGKELITISL